MMKKLVVVLLLFTFTSYSQKSELIPFKNLLKKTWQAEGTWASGEKFKQEVFMNYNLGDAIVLTGTRGFTNKDKTAFGKISHGVRSYDPDSGKIKFWEFDKFGGVTEGIVEFKEKDVYYIYEYNGIIITDLWEYVDDFTYKFKVGVLEEKVWSQVFLETTFNARRHN